METEIIKVSDLYTVRSAVIRGRTRTFNLKQINDLITKAATSAFVSGYIREKIEEVIRGINSEANGGCATLH